MNTTLEAAVKPIGAATHGSPLGASLRSLFRSLGYTPVCVRLAMEHVEDQGTATGCEAIDDADREVVQALIEKHTGRHDYESAADWPSLYDEGQWITWDSIDAPDEPYALFEDPPFEPSPEDRAWASRMLNEDSASDLAAVEDRAVWDWLDGLECESDRITDFDMARCGAVG